ncbi:hypothetical protein B0H14DRAFT_3785263 [Mycena olivaceomarginata]|nr:hypothetical protein B0H14DRAFT_3785263 [Mycena olivaceomarginata]
MESGTECPAFEQHVATFHQSDAFKAKAKEAAPDIYRPEVMQTIEAEIDRLGPQLVNLSKQIHEKAELKFHENFVHDTLSDFIASQWFEVTKNYKSDVPSETETPKFMKTAWRASFTNIPKETDAIRTARTLGVNSEMDALPVPKALRAHALQPWEGVNAQDAVMLSHNAISMLRQQIRPDLRVHGVVYYNKEPLPANVIPADMSMVWNIRAPTKTDLDAKEFTHIATVRCGMKEEEANGNGAFSTDFGNVPYALPGVHPGYAIPTVPNGGNHTAEFTAAAITPEAHKETLKVTKALSLLGFRVIDDGKFFNDVKGQFDATSK